MSCSKSSAALTWTASLMAVNAADRHYLSFIEHLLPTALEKQMGVIGMKVATRGRML